LSGETLIRHAATVPNRRGRPPPLPPLPQAVHARDLPTPRRTILVRRIRRATERSFACTSPHDRAVAILSIGVLREDGLKRRFRTRLMVAPASLRSRSPFGPPSAGPDGPRLTSAPSGACRPARAGREVRHPPDCPNRQDDSGTDTHSMHWGAHGQDVPRRRQ
jgi:hypothetical protein